MKTIPPGYTLLGKVCKACEKSWKIHGTYCSRPGHHKTRYIKDKKKKLEKIAKTFHRDFNYCELIAAVCLKFPDIHNREDIISSSEDIQCLEITKYLQNLECRSDTQIHNYIKFVNSHRGAFPNIKEVYLIGKSKSNFPELDFLSQGLDIKDNKADLFLVDTQDRWIGVSIKSSPQDFLTNFSLEKLFPNGEEIKQVRLEYLREQGYSHFKKEERQEVNELFYQLPGRENPYWFCIKESITQHKFEMLKYLINTIYSQKVPYPMIELNGVGMKCLQNDFPGHLSHQDLKLELQPSSKNSAKLTYHIIIRNSPQLKMEIRWKGNVYQSPQIMVSHLDLCDKLANASF